MFKQIDVQITFAYDRFIANIRPRLFYFTSLFQLQDDVFSELVLRTGLRTSVALRAIPSYDSYISRLLNGEDRFVDLSPLQSEQMLSFNQLLQQWTATASNELASMDLRLMDFAGHFVAERWNATGPHQLFTFTPVDCLVFDDATVQVAVEYRLPSTLPGYPGPMLREVSQASLEYIFALPPLTERYGREGQSKALPPRME